MAESRDFDIGNNVDNYQQLQLVHAVAIPRYMPWYSTKYYDTKYLPASSVHDYLSRVTMILG